MVSGSILAALLPNSAHAILGSEMVPLMQLVAGQVSELESLAQQLGATQEQTGLLFELNSGVNKVVNQIESLESIVERTQGLNPSSARSLASLNDLMRRARATQEDLNALIQIRTEVADQAIAQSALQSDTAYRMGQEMVVTGSELARESKTASPGRAAQISASADAAQMLSQGVELQTLAQIAELQALSLDFQKTQATQVNSESDQRKKAFEATLSAQAKRRGPR
ncbi:hypothetical protein EBZ37_08100 [bacterium]|nr:hypothetical protein [bacterium]